jgi:hypothetical protein
MTKLKAVAHLGMIGGGWTELLQLAALWICWSTSQKAYEGLRPVFFNPRTLPRQAGAGGRTWGTRPVPYSSAGSQADSFSRFDGARMVLRVASSIRSPEMQ